MPQARCSARDRCRAHINVRALRSDCGERMAERIRPQTVGSQSGSSKSPRDAGQDSFAGRGLYPWGSVVPRTGGAGFVSFLAVRCWPPTGALLMVPADFGRVGTPRSGRAERPLPCSAPRHRIRRQVENEGRAVGLSEFF